MSGAPAPLLHAAEIQRLPKVELHRHVDGAVRTGTLLELARRAGIALPAGDVAGLAPHVQVGAGCRSLRAFLATFETFYPVLAVPGALERVGEELLLDAAADGIVHLEARLCPALLARPGHDARAVLREALAGIAAGVTATGTRCGVIVCCYRSLPADVNAALVELAIEHIGDGVVGVDLAGPEDLPGASCAGMFARARAAGLGVTVHAGEAAGPASIVEALERLGARRLGHAVALREDPALVRRVADAGVALECCLTSNLHTGAVRALAEHPFERLRESGCAVTLNTDDPAVSDVTLSGELALAARTWGYELPALASLQRTAADAAFLDEVARAALHRRLAGATAR